MPLLDKINSRAPARSDQLPLRSVLEPLLSQINSRAPARLDQLPLRSVPEPLLGARLTARTAGMVERYDDMVSNKGSKDISFVSTWKQKTQNRRVSDPSLRAGCATEAKRSGRRGSGECGCSAIVGHRRRGNLPSHYPLSYSVPAGDSVGLKKPSHRS
ncbi:hypothetical protein B296_00015415 [Ensete ventricosum]|uniref:Uncharacterized protein n=1 Tax=Ensete ventricosum TaxID=4639 RepID=A0A426XWA6_ENSVE|nr:hypothetical protein B296_00015415 [Ensete ventricosum]